MVTGIHHVSMRCGRPEEFERAKAFYCGVLGLEIRREWPEGVLIDTGNGLIEIFNHGEGETGKGAVRHFALAADDVDRCAEQILPTRPFRRESPSAPAPWARRSSCSRRCEAVRPKQVNRNWGKGRDAPFPSFRQSPPLDCPAPFAVYYTIRDKMC